MYLPLFIKAAVVANNINYKQQDALHVRHLHPHNLIRQRRHLGSMSLSQRTYRKLPISPIRDLDSPILRRK